MLFDKEILKQWSRIWRDSVVGNKLRQTDKNSPGRQIIKYHQDLSRRCSTILIQLRTGRSTLRAEAFKMRLSNNSNCECGARETRQHLFLSCPRYAEQRQQLLQSIKAKAIDINALLTDPATLKPTLLFIHETERFPRYYTNLRKEDGKEEVVGSRKVSKGSRK
jgi:hypothetical protein